MIQNPVPPPVQRPYQVMPSPNANTPNAALIVIVGVLWMFTLIGMFFIGRASVRPEAPLPISNTAPHFGTPLPVSSPPENAIPADSQVLVTTPEELHRAFDENSIKATDWIKNKRIQITAPIYSLSNNMFGGDRAAVVFKIKTGGFIEPTIDFWFDGSFRSQIGNLQEGQMVTVEGSFKEQQFGGDLQFEGLSLR